MQGQGNGREGGVLGLLDFDFTKTIVLKGNEMAQNAPFVLRAQSI